MTVYTIRRETIPEQEISGRRLGRHIHHDSRSLRYLVPLKANPVTKMWDRKIPVLDQGNLGSCVGNASDGTLGTEPFYSTLVSLINSGKLTLDETGAVKIYSLATKLDSYSGTYPPVDTGSDGLSGAKACQQLGLISGYQHATSIDAMISALQTRPGIVGVNWMAGMDDVNTSTGEIKPTGAVRGGHEFEVFGVDMERGQFWFYQSWGQNWGLNNNTGKMFMTIENFETLLKQDGDATFFTPLTSEPPTPTPTPVGSADQTLIKAMDPWAATIISRITKAGKAKTAYENWKKVKGL